MYVLLYSPVKFLWEILKFPFRVTFSANNLSTDTPRYSTALVCTCWSQYLTKYIHNATFRQKSRLQYCLKHRYIISVCCCYLVVPFITNNNSDYYTTTEWQVWRWIKWQNVCLCVNLIWREIKTLQKIYGPLQKFQAPDGWHASSMLRPVHNSVARPNCRLGFVHPW